MNAVLVDSDVAIEVLRNRDKAIRSRWAEMAAGETHIMYSPVTVAEIWHGVREGEQLAVRAWFEAMICVPVDASIAIKAGEYLRRFHRSHGVELGDALIAATAAIHGLQLWTRNKKHYPMTEIQLC